MKKKRTKRSVRKKTRRVNRKKPSRKKISRRKISRKKITKLFLKKELNVFKKLILQKKEQILEDINHISEDTLKKSQKEASGDISGYAYHMADVATDSYDREFSLGLASNDRKVLYEFDDALKRIEEGTFGVCEECNLPIPKTRLKAVPYARLCIKCQQKRERR